MRFSYRRVAFFEDFGRCKITCYVGAVLGGSWGGFWEGFGPCYMDFRALETSQILKPKLDAEKVVPSPSRDLRGESGGGSGDPNIGE